MASPNPADHPLPLSPELNSESSPSTIPFALPVPSSTDSASASASADVELLITELRASLSSSQALLSTQATRLSTLADVETELSQLKDQYSFLSAAKEAVESQLKEEVRKREVAEENVDALRGQVEQARRGVMQLQKQEKERKRMSTISSISGTGVGSLGLGFGDEEVLASEQSQRESKLVKRQSMIGRGHRRASSQSEPNDIHAHPIATSPNPQAAGAAGGTLRPGVGGLRELRLGHSSPSSNPLPSPIASNNPSQSGYFDDAPAAPQRKATLTDSPPSKLDLRREQDTKTDEEVTKLRVELQSTQAQLHESEEARLASETCLRALREFIAASGGGGGGGSGGGGEGDVAEGEGGMTASTAELLKGIRLPPLPTDKDQDEELDTKAAEKEKAKPTGWAFKLWAGKQSAPGTSPGSTVVEPPFTPQNTLTPAARSRANSSATAATTATGTGIGMVAGTPRYSPLPTPTEVDEGGLTPSASTSTITPLSAFVSNWTKNVSPGKPPASTAATPSNTASAGAEQAGTTTRKLSMPSFFSRSSLSGPGKRGSTTADVGPTTTINQDKELPTPPADATGTEEEGYDLSKDTPPLQPTAWGGEVGLEPSATIRELKLDHGTEQSGMVDDEEEADGEEGVLPGRVRRNKRESQGTTVTDLEEELGTTGLEDVPELAVEDSLGQGQGQGVREQADGEEGERQV